MKNLYLIHLDCSNYKLLVAGDNEEHAKDVAYTGLSFGDSITLVEFIAVVVGDFGNGKIIKYIEL